MNSASASRDKFEALVLPHLDALHRMACALTANEAEAQDLVQETCVRGFRGFAGFELREYGARPWLFRILHNVYYSMRHRQRRAPSILHDVDFDHFEDELAHVGEQPLAAGEINWEGFDEEIKKAVAELQPEYRIVLLLWAIEGLSYKEMAEVCQCALGTIMSRLYRARQILGRRLRSYAKERRLLRNGTGHELQDLS